MTPRTEVGLSLDMMSERISFEVGIALELRTSIALSCFVSGRECLKDNNILFVWGLGFVVVGFGVQSPPPDWVSLFNPVLELTL